MNAMLRRLSLFFGIISLFTSCQTSRLVLGTPPQPAGAEAATQEVLLHDSQGPQATRVTLTAAEAAVFRQQ
ncbi:hypothetical protein [Hymenobacter algoricola]|uniref:Uncharacterized protein n=1 Tax=Hymenobacter algoricola TaxID=486267 RepID=A0ABP7MH31_9BACT